MSIETRFDVSFVSALALREKQIQQNYRPIIAVHKWFARRPGSLFRALALAEFGDRPLKHLYFSGNDFPNRKIADPFMGGGIPLIEANRLGFDVEGFDINPMSAWIVREEIEHLDIAAYRRAAASLLRALHSNLGELYLTDCPHYGDTKVPVKYFLWVKVIDCEFCGENIDLFPGYVLAEDRRHPKNVLVCPRCSDLNEVTDRNHPPNCQACGVSLEIKGPARRGRCACSNCGRVNRYPRGDGKPISHRLFAIEYFNPYRRSQHKGRFFKKPDEKDLARVAEASERYGGLHPRFVPDQHIPPGDETDRLRRWGYSHYRQLFNDRQLIGLETSCRLIEEIEDQRIKHALATNLSDLLRYQNMLCRYDTGVLKSLDIFSVHGFPVGLIACESNILGIPNGRGANVGSGGWTNIIDKYAKAKTYCGAPFETRREGSRSVRVPIQGEWIGESADGFRTRRVSIHCADASTVELEPNSLDAVFTDPPYYGNVQYGELMDFCYVWLRALVGDVAEGFWQPSTRTVEELTGNVTLERGLPQFTEGLARIYRHMAGALKPGAPFAFTFHHNRLEVYIAVGIAILDADLACSASLPCPGEMGGSIHIHGKNSSIIDTVFVCRNRGDVRKGWLFSTAEELESIVADDLEKVRASGHQPTLGDKRCIVFGHLTRMAIWNLRSVWNFHASTEEKTVTFSSEIGRLPDMNQVLEHLDESRCGAVPPGPLFDTAEPILRTADAVAF